MEVSDIVCQVFILLISDKMFVEIFRYIIPTLMSICCYMGANVVLIRIQGTVIKGECGHWYWCNIVLEFADAEFMLS